MLQKFTKSLLLVLFIFTFNSSFSQNNKAKRHVALDGSEVGTTNSMRTAKTFLTDNNFQPLTVSNYVVNFTALGLSSFYDLQSNSTPNEIWQDPTEPLNVHAAVMVLPAFGGTRVCQYLFSEDRGLTWLNSGNISESASGFPSIDGLSNGSAIVAMHTTAGGAPAAITQAFVDIGPGFGAFNRQAPGENNGASLIWPRIIGTKNVLDASKYVISASTNPAATTSTINGLDLGSPGTFGPWQDYLSDNAEQYCFGLGEDGRIGNAYINADGLGDVMFRESMDGGVTWGSPITIFDADPAVDSLYAFRGMSMVYLGNTPCVTFEVDNLEVTGTIGVLPSYIRFWSPAVNGGQSYVVAGPANIPYFPNNGPAATYGVFSPVCRPSLGKTNSPGSPVLFLAVNASTSEVAASQDAYYCTYFMVSYNGGASWSTPERITPTTPLKDYRYVSISHTSGLNAAGDHWTVQMLVEVHDYAGAYAPSEPPGPSDFLSMRVDVPPVGINEISSTVPTGFALKQNFPNPFNPTTNIRFDIQKASKVTLEVYNTSGIKVATLINNEFVTPGTKEVTFDGVNLSSGVYFYTLSAADFKETKKMMLIK